MAIDKSKIKTLEKLKEKGFDTANKIRPLAMEEVFENGLENELGNIIGLKKAIKANHSELAWLLDGSDPKPSKGNWTMAFPYDDCEYVSDFDPK